MKLIELLVKECNLPGGNTAALLRTIDEALQSFPELNKDDIKTLKQRLLSGCPHQGQKKFQTHCGTEHCAQCLYEIVQKSGPSQDLQCPCGKKMSLKNKKDVGNMFSSSVDQSEGAMPNPAVMGMPKPIESTPPAAFNAPVPPSIPPFPGAISGPTPLPNIPRATNNPLPQGFPAPPTGVSSPFNPPPPPQPNLGMSQAFAPPPPQQVFQPQPPQGNSKLCEVCKLMKDNDDFSLITCSTHDICMRCRADNYLSGSNNCPKEECRREYSDNDISMFMITVDDLFPGRERTQLDDQRFWCNGCSSMKHKTLLADFNCNCGKTCINCKAERGICIGCGNP